MASQTDYSARPMCWKIQNTNFSPSQEKIKVSSYCLEIEAKRWLHSFR